MLRIAGIHLRNVRNYSRTDLNITGRLTIFVGPNAIGKTNIVEMVQLLTAGQSFRHARSADIIRSGADGGRSHIEVTDGNRYLELALALSKNSRTYSLNGKAKRVMDMRGIVPSVTFTPDDLDLMKGSPTTRRSALDALGVQLNKNYSMILKDFEKVLRHKNRLLKDGDLVLLDAVNDLYITVAAKLQEYRGALFARLEPLIADHYARLANGEELRGTYKPSRSAGTNANPLPEDSSDADTGDDAPVVDTLASDIQSELARAVQARRADEIVAKRALVGPTHDRIDFTIDEMDAGRFASQGQQRSAVLAWKLAEADIIEEMLGTFPVLLLDDVMSELDAARRGALVAYLQRDTQAFITTANLDYFDDQMLEEAQIVHLPLEDA